MKKKVLLTNFQMIEYTGSEIDTLTMADYFIEHNYDVDIFTLEYGYPIYNKINSKIRIITFETNDLLQEHYDLIWSHHYPLLDYLLFYKQIKADYIHHICLSSYMAYEAPPEYYKYLNMISLNSRESLDSIKEENYNYQIFNIFTNYANTKYFNKKVTLSKKIKKICIVSNHIPEELLDLKEVMYKNNIECDIYGNNYIYKKIDEDVLKNYDLIISIGKTINYGLALGIPCYCYDHFGGDLYINKDNIEESYYYNFSGRYSRKKLNGQELYDDIILNYKNTLSQVDYLKKYAYDNFCYEKMMEETLEKIYKTEKFDLDKLLAKYPEMIRISLLFVERVSEKINELNTYAPKIEKCQFYFRKNDEEYNEENSIIRTYKIDDNMNYSVEIELPKNCDFIRFDFTDKQLMMLKSIYINDKKYKYDKFFNCFELEGNIVSLNNDPSIIIDVRKNKNNILKILVKMKKMNSSDVIIKLLEKDKEIYNENLELSNRINNIIKSKSWRITKPIRKINTILSKISKGVKNEKQ